MEFMEFEGKSTEEAIARACAHFQLPAESLDIEIISVGSPGLFGIGGRKARIRVVTQRDVDESEAEGGGEGELEGEAEGGSPAPGPGTHGAHPGVDGGKGQGGGAV